MLIIPINTYAYEKWMLDIANRGTLHTFEIQIYAKLLRNHTEGKPKTSDNNKSVLPRIHRTQNKKKRRFRKIES